MASAGWAGHVSNAGEVVASNIKFAGADLSGFDSDRAATVVRVRSGYILSTPIVIDTGQGELVVTAEDVGFEYSNEDVLAEIEAARHEGSALDTFGSWASSLVLDIEVEDQYTFDEAAARNFLGQARELTLKKPVEPFLTSEGTNFLYVEPGELGTGVDIDLLIADIQELDLTAGEQTVSVQTVDLLPTMTDDFAEEVGAQLNELTENGMEVIVGVEHAALSKTELRRHLDAPVVNGDFQVSFDVDGLQDEIEAKIAAPVGNFVPPTFGLIDGDIVVEQPGRAPPICCGTDSVREAAEGILAGGAGPWHLTPRTSDNVELTAWADGSLIVDKVGEFTTPHSCCQSRVVNIQRMADIVRGSYLLPGDVFSLNENVQRTRANGFVAGGAIRSGRLTDEVGGGVSQFATTLFNAAYFAGLDFVEYKAHSIYFSRYPFGREATVSTPKPDLIIENTTQYPLLIWTSYEPNSITVTMYSTQNVDVFELGQRRSRRGRCAYVETDRQRTYPNGEIRYDTFEATYRPAEGRDCAGNVIGAG